MQKKAMIYLLTIKIVGCSILIVRRKRNQTSTGRLINADLNGALNILKKEIPNAFNEGYGIEVCSMPLVLTIK